MPKPPKPTGLSMSGSLHGTDLYISTGTVKTPNVDQANLLVNHYIVLEHNGTSRRWIGRILQGTTTVGSTETKWDFEVVCVRNGKAPKVSIPKEIEAVSVTIISPNGTTTADQSDPYTAPNINID